MTFKNIPTVLSADEILEKAFKRADKFDVWNVKGSDRVKSQSASKLSSFGHTISNKLRSYVRTFPSLDQLHPFYYSLLDLKINNDKLRHSLGAIQWAAKTTDNILKECNKKLARTKGKKEMEKIRKAAYGRISSVVHKVEKDLELLQDAREFIRHLPHIEVDEPVIVIAGAPNVGKSLIMTKLTSARPKIAEYPFTTQSIGIGHVELERQIFQIIDTPGLLDRPLEERNDIERQAILAIEHIAHLIVFIFDPSETCGYFMEKQENLFKAIKESFPDAKVLAVSNKSDLATSEHLMVSALEDKGFEQLKKAIYNFVK